LINPGNVCRHELTGLAVKVESSTNSFQNNISGRIVDETKNMLVIHTGTGLKKVQKIGAVFQIHLPDDTLVRVDGSVLASQPEKRISMRIKNPR
jgi:ribonuclease P protein subunit POP4